MVKPKQILPFTYEGAETWSSDTDETVEIALKADKKSGTKIKFKESLFVFSGQESGEKLIRWFKIYTDKILKNRTISWDEKITVLRRIVKKEAEKILERVLDGTAPANVAQYKWEYNIGVNKMESLRKDTAGFSHSMKNDDSIDRKVAAWCEGKLTAVVKDKTDNDRKVLMIEDKVHDDILEEYQQLVIGEIYWKFAMRVFGSDHEGMQTYITLRRMIRNFKVRLQSGIIAWKDRVTKFNEFLEYCPWKAGNAANYTPRSFSEEEIREILSNAITYEQRLHLGNHNHDIIMVPFE